MRLALALYKYFPHGGLQRDFHCILAELLARGHACRVYCQRWQGAVPAGADLRLLPARGSSARRGRRFLAALRADLAAQPVDGLVGFNRMPGLDVYYAADPCFRDRAQRERGPLYRRGGRFRHFSAWEEAVFGAGSDTDILVLTASARDSFQHHYGTPLSRFHLLPPAVAADRARPPDAPRRRRALREQLGVGEGELLLLFVGSGFVTKGLDRAVRALAALRAAQPATPARLLVAGQDRRRPFQRQVRRLGIADRVAFLGGRDDVPDLMLAADVLVHPARREAAGIVLLEALVLGLPAIVAADCGHAPHVAAANAGRVLPSPFDQGDLDRAVLRMLDGVYRAECRERALDYAGSLDFFSGHRRAAALVEALVARRCSGRG